MPDLLAVPYSIFDNNQEIEISYMCVGRGNYSIDEIRDGDTLISAIAGAGIEVYGPYTSPNSGDPPQIQIGTPIDQPVLSVTRLNEVNGQVLRPPNSNNVRGDEEIRFVYPDTIEREGGSDIDFTEFFQSSDEITVGNATFSGPNATGSVDQDADALFATAADVVFLSYDPSTDFAASDTITITGGAYAGNTSGGGVLYVDLSGTYVIASVDSNSITLSSPATVNDDWNAIYQYPGGQTDFRTINISKAAATVNVDLAGTYDVVSVTASEIVLSNPAIVNPDWADLDEFAGNATDYISPNIATTGESWIGPFIVESDDTDRLLANFVALGGLFKDNGKKQTAVSVQLQIESTPVDEDDVPTGPAEDFFVTMDGNTQDRETRASSLWCDLAALGRQSARAKRITPADLDYDGTVIDEVKWRDLYGVAAVDALEFGNVTTVMSRTYATNSALAVKDRKLNMFATRLLPQWISGTSFGPPVATERADDIITAICLDPSIGGMTTDQVDLANVYAEVQAIEDYFGTDLAARFNYTFDDDNLSAQDTLAVVGTAVFSTIYRQGEKVRMTFERASDESVLIFNGRNTKPRSQNRAVRFGIIDDQDGIQLDYTAESDGATLAFKIPDDGSAVRPRDIEITGLRYAEQAYWHGNRAWNRMRYQNQSLQLDGTDEATILVRNDRILVSDLTRAAEIVAGDVDAISGLRLTLSDSVALDDYQDWTIFLQYYDGTVESMAVYPVAGEAYQVDLQRPPRLDLSVDPNNAARAKYEIVGQDDIRSRAFLVIERDRNDDRTHTIKCGNYTFLLYMNDQLELWIDFTNDAYLESDYIDSGPYDRDGVPAGDATTMFDTAIGREVYLSAGAGSMTFPAFTPPASYTVSVWVKRADLSGSGQLLSSASRNFGFAAGLFVAGHSGTQLQATWPDISEYHHAVLTYDADDGAMVLYIDGVTMASTDGIAASGTEQLVAFSGLEGQAYDLRLWRRTLTQSEVKTIFHAR